MNKYLPFGVSLLKPRNPKNKFPHFHTGVKTCPECTKFRFFTSFGASYSRHHCEECFTKKRKAKAALTAERRAARAKEKRSMTPVKRVLSIAEKKESSRNYYLNKRKELKSDPEKYAAFKEKEKLRCRKDPDEIALDLYVRKQSTKDLRFIVDSLRLLKGFVKKEIKKYSSFTKQPLLTSLSLPPNMKRCGSCKEVLPTQLFPRRKDSNVPFKSRCKPCYNTARREKLALKRLIDPTFREIEKSKRKLQSDRYYDRLRDLPTSWSIKDKLHMLDYFKGKCVYCKEAPFTDRDHYIPVSNPSCPGTIPTNIVPACSPCNTAKSGHSPFDHVHPTIQEEIKVYFESLLWYH